MAKQPKKGEAPVAAPETVAIEALTPIRLDGDDYAEGERIEAAPGAAAALIAAGAAVAAVTTPATPATPATQAAE